MKLITVSTIVAISIFSSSSYAFDLGNIVGEFTNVASKIQNIAGMPQKNKAAKLQSDQRRTKIEGAVAGAVGGAILGKVFGGGKGSKAMLQGALLGTVVGTIAGHEVAKVKRKTAYTQDRLNRQLYLLTEDIKNTRKNNQNTRKYALIVRKRITSLGRNKRGRMALANELTNVIRNKQNIIKIQTHKLKNHQKLIANAKNQARLKKERINSSRNDNGVASLKKEIYVLQTEVNRLARTKTNLLANQS